MAVVDPSPPLDVAAVRAVIETQADPAKVEPMAAYMRNQFAFLGVANPLLRKAVKPWLASTKTTDGDQLLSFADDCWRQPEREFQTVAVLLLRKRAANLEERHLTSGNPSSREALSAGSAPASVESLIITKSWWDTVDGLAAWVVGPMVTAHPALTATMDDWIESDNIWLARTAILHQLGYKSATDAQRLFAYAERRADDTEFFIRKAIGWALRQYAREDADAVRRFVADNEHRLSGLSKREALKHIG